jgi:hypothetical protein
MSQGSVYERQVDSVLTGGWNLLAPGDILSPAEALQVQNFVPYSAGNLESRKGHSQSFGSVGTARNICVVRGTPPRRYSATYSGNVFMNGLPTGGGGIGITAMVSYQGFLWAMSRGRQNKHDGTSWLSWAPAAPADPTVAAIAGGYLVVGKIYTYWITYTATGGQESPSNAAGQTVAPIVDGDQTVRITSPAASGDPQVTGWNVYRVGNTLQDALRLNTVPIPIGTDFDDTGDPGIGLGDVQVSKLGIALDPNADGPPAGNGLAGPYFERLLAWGVADHPNRLYYSGTLQPYNFPGSSLDIGNHVDIGEKGEGIVAVTLRPRYSTIYKDNSIWRLVGDPGDIDADLECVTEEIGASGAQAVIGPLVTGMDYFQGPEGLYSFNGETARKITGKLDLLFRGEVPNNEGFAYPTDPRLNQDPLAKARNCLAHRFGRLYFFYCSGDVATQPTSGIHCLLGADNWGSISYHAGSVPTAVLSEGQETVDEATGAFSGGGQLVAVLDDQLVFLEDSDDDDGVAIPLAYQSSYRDQGAPDNQKMYADVVIEHNTHGAALSVGAHYNNGASSEPLGTITSAARTVSTFQCNLGGDRLGTEARNIAIRIEGNTSGSGVFIYKVKVHYYVLPRDSKTYESDETDLGTERVKELSELELDIDAGGAVTWYLFADKPGTAMTQRDTGAIAATTGRQMLRIPLDANIQGRLARLALRCDAATFRLYGARIRVLPIGEYVDNSAGEVFETLPINVGVN